MKISIVAALTLLVGISTAATAQTTTTTPPTPHQATTPGYDRPTASNGHQHVVYWSSIFDDMDIDPQVAADAKSIDDLHMKAKARKPNK